MMKKFGQRIWVQVVIVRPDGSVEAALEGSREAVEAVLAWLRVGPRRAEVDSVEVREEPVQDERGFRVRGG